MRLLTPVLFASATLVPVAAAPAIAEAPAVPRAPGVVERVDTALPDYLVIGSSMASVLEMSYGTEGYAALSARHSVIIDAKGCRTLIKPSCNIGDRPAPTNALESLRSHAGTFDSGVVIVVGANDPTEGENGIAAAISAVLDEAERQGIPWVAWLTYHEDSTVGVKMRAHNRVLREVAGVERRLVLADWNTLADMLPAGWIGGDGIHIGAQAATALAELIADTLDLMERSGPGSTPCSLSTQPRRTAGTNWTTAAETLSRARATSKASRLQLRCP